jgi:hypothetical protein
MSKKSALFESWQFCSLATTVIVMNQTLIPQAGKFFTFLPYLDCRPTFIQLSTGLYITEEEPKYGLYNNLWTTPSKGVRMLPGECTELPLIKKKVTKVDKI